MELDYGQVTVTKILSPLILESIPGTNGRYVRLAANFGFYSDVLDCEIWVLKGFVCDKESVPGLRGSCPEGGVAHDYLSRYDSNPVVTKHMAALVYLELMELMYSLDDNKVSYGKYFKLRYYLNKAWDGVRRFGKFGIVSIWPGYFHKLSILATIDDITQ